jgi:hypothetical protein
MAVGFPTKANWAAGDVLTAAQMDDLAGTVNLLQNSAYPIMGGKNALINGGFDIWQRGTTSSTSGVFLADRWYDYMATGTGTYSQESTTVPSGSRYAIKFTASASATPQILQAIETANAIQFAGKIVNLSGQFAASTSTQINLILEYSTTVDNALLGTWTQIAASSGTPNATPTSTTYVQATATYSIPSTAKSLRVTISPNAAIANTVSVYYGQIQLELGSTATTFARSGGNIQGELAACQRYYARFAGGAIYSMYGNGYATSATNLMNLIKIPQTMRVTPTAVDYANLYATNIATSNTVSAVTLSASYIGPDYIGVNATTTTGLIAGNVYSLVNGNNIAGYIGFSAEL